MRLSSGKTEIEPAIDEGGHAVGRARTQWMRRGAACCCGGNRRIGPDFGLVICGCFGVGLAAIRDALGTGTATDVDTIGHALPAGTKCGTDRGAQLRRLHGHEQPAPVGCENPPDANRRGSLATPRRGSGHSTGLSKSNVSSLVSASPQGRRRARHRSQGPTVPHARGTRLPRSRSRLPGARQETPLARDAHHGGARQRGQRLVELARHQLQKAGAEPKRLAERQAR
jgi:bacterioferritin-associated ferredoxin